MTFIFFIFLVGLLIWSVRINTRLVAIERKLARTTEVPAAGYAVRREVSLTPEAPIKDASRDDVLPKARDASTVSEHSANWLNRIGVLALLFGMAFFIKYAIDEGWVSEAARVLIEAIFGGLLMLLGYLWREKYRSYAMTMLGGGVAMLYLSIFAAFQYYSLISQEIAFLLMLVVSAVTLAIARQWSSKLLAGIGVGSAYLIPSLLYANSGQQTGLFVYLLILSVVVLMILQQLFSWELFMLGFFATVFNYFGLLYEYSTPEASIIFTLAVLILYLLGGAIAFRIIEQKKKLTHQADIALAAVGVFALGFYLLNLHLVLDLNFHEYLTPMAVLGAAVAAVGYLIVDRLEYSKINYVYAASAVILCDAAAGWYFHDKQFVLSILLIALMTLAPGVFYKRVELRLIAVIQMVMNLFLLFSIVRFENSDYFLLNSQFALMAAQVAGFGILTLLYRSADKQLEERGVENILPIFGVFLLWVAVSIEIYRAWNMQDQMNTQNLLLSLWWGVYALAILVWGAFSKNGILRKAGLVLLSLGILKVFLYDVQTLELGYRVVSFIALGVLLLGLSFAYQKYKEKIKEFLL